MAQVKPGENREKLIKKLSYEVTFSVEPPYPELETALGALVDALGRGETPGVSPDWAAVVSEAVNLRPQH